MNEFEKSIRDIEGLTAFKQWSLPEWLPKRIDAMFASRKEGPLSDADFVDEFIRGEWLGNWGMATINGKDVFIFEYSEEDTIELYEPARIAEKLHCGLVVVEPSWPFLEVTIVGFTEHLAFIRRRKAASVALAAI